MPKRFVSIYFKHLTTDWFTRKRPVLKQQPFVLVINQRGRKVVTAANPIALAQGVASGITLADARAIVSEIQVFDEAPGIHEKLLKGLGEWSIRYTPTVAIDPPNGLLMDASGCTHLWGDERFYLIAISAAFRGLGYDVSVAMADTIGTAWAMARFGQSMTIIANGVQADALMALPPAALRLEPSVLGKMEKLGLYKVSSFITMSRAVLRRRFGDALLIRIDQALGHTDEVLQPLQPVLPFQERLPCLEPIMTATGIEIALERLLLAMCNSLEQKGMGLRSAVLTCYRVDDKVQQIDIGTNRATHNALHLYKLFENKICNIEPALGIELFVLDAPKVEVLSKKQVKIWANDRSLDDVQITELLDSIANKFGSDTIHRFLPAEHHWPERSIKIAASLEEQPTIPWSSDSRRPMHLLSTPESIMVTAPIPDYPPMLFRYKNQLHTIKKADGPERIEREWWLESGEHRDYYIVEDEEGQRFWVFRSGHYSGDKPHAWFMHGFFA